MGQKTAGGARLVEAARVLARLARIAERACQKAGLSLSQYRILLFVSQQPQRASELASKVAVSRPALTDLVDGLERHGYLLRVPVEGDRRGIGLELTAEGAEAVKRAEESLTSRLDSLVGKGELIGRLAELGPVLDLELDRRLREAAGETGKEAT